MTTESPLPCRYPSLDITTERPWEDNFNYCIVRREVRELVTCHVCEAGHHVHVRWFE